MQLVDDQILFAPSDLITFMESPFASHMERWCLVDVSVKAHRDDQDPLLKSLQSKGYAHEDKFLQSLREEGKDVVEIGRASPKKMMAESFDALNAGAEVITQAYLQAGQFGGLADFLVKVPGSSKLGAYHYEVWDTKLARRMKPYFAVQLSCYAEMLEAVQGVRPKEVAIVLGNDEIERLRLADYFNYYQSLKSSFLEFHETWTTDRLPDPAESRAHGRWSEYATSLLDERRHLSKVANITRTQISRLEAAGIETIDDLAATKLTHIAKLNSDILARHKVQASLQIDSEQEEKPKFLVSDHAPGDAVGLALLPPQSPNDVYFDLEGYPLHDDGLEYLWGATYFDENNERQFRDYWAHNHDQEKQAFIAFVDWVFERWCADPTMHIYHYAAYEVTVLRRLMGRYGVREFEVDSLLRNHVFVDLYTVVRHGVMVGEPSYSIKNVEHLYRGQRDTGVGTGGESVVVYEEWRESPDGETWKESNALSSIRDYNIDDCNSTQELAAWLRAQQAAHAIAYVGAAVGDDVVTEEEETEVTLLRDDLLARSETEPDENKSAVIRNLAWLLEFHPRENKPVWWRLFDRLGLTELDLYDDMDCLVGAERTGTEAYLPTPRARNKVYEYRFDINQPYKGTAKAFYVLGEGDRKARCVDYDPNKGLIALQSKEELPDRLSLVPDEYVNPTPIPEAVFDVVTQLMESDFSQNAITKFLLRLPPDFIDGARSPIVAPDLENHDFLEAVVAAAADLNDSYLCIQGPPGAGKTYTARHIIIDLLKSGKRVGISSNSHKAILNLLGGVAKQCDDEKIKARLIKIGGPQDDDFFIDHMNVQYESSVRALEGDSEVGAMCIGGTAWAFCNEVISPAAGFAPLDYLFVDEAGQVSVANLVGMSRAAKNIILMGDQMQLGQPSQGSHPDDSGMSVLEYLLQDHATIPSDMGVFLPRTYRMHPDVCAIISEQVYEDRLKSANDTKRHVINVPRDVLPSGCGVHFLPVVHEGNTQGSEEEVEVICKLARALIGVDYWPESEGGVPRQIGWNDLLFVAPYNYEVNLLKAALGENARVGSVDKFQGQEAPIVFVSMCASDASESPRGIDFLFSKNRLNVAISRAQALAVVVGSPELARTPTNNIRQMSLVNFFSAITQIGRQ